MEEQEIDELNNILSQYKSISDYYYGERDNLINKVLDECFPVIPTDEDDSILRMFVADEEKHRLKAELENRLPEEVMPGEEELFLQRFHDYYGIPKHINTIINELEKDIKIRKRINEENYW